MGSTDMSNSKRFWYCIVCLVTVITWSGCAGIFSRERVKEEPSEDVKMAMSIKSKLLQESGLNAAAIHVEAKEGIIQLSGFVDTESQRQRASAVARSVSGVQHVNNQIQLK
jgi:osmotically-inducible protein OsmY